MLHYFTFNSVTGTGHHTNKHPAYLHLSGQMHVQVETTEALLLTDVCYLALCPFGIVPNAIWHSLICVPHSDMLPFSILMLTS